MRIIHKPDQFEDWLRENHWFHDCHVLTISPLPSSEGKSLPSTATIELAYPIEGHYTAYSTRVLRAFRLAATGIDEFRLLADWGPSGISSEHCSEGIELLDSGDAIAFSIDLPAILIMRCREMTIEDLPNIVETVKPYLSDREVYARVRGSSMPTPGEWVDLFQQHGEEVAWHVYSGEPKVTREVPQDYGGWFIQAMNLFDDQRQCNQGVFFMGCSSVEDGFQVHIQNHCTSQRLWQAAKTILGQFAGVEVRCGNCKFNGSEWLEELNRAEKTA